MMNFINTLYNNFASNFATNAIAILSLIISIYVAYRTLLAKFKGNVWPANAVVLMYVDDIPSIGVGCFIENTGARPGRLDDMRLIVEHRSTASTYHFYPQLVRDDYNIFADYQDKDWFPFSGVTLLAGDKLEKFVIFKPLNDKFSANVGEYQIAIQVRWNERSSWQPVSPGLTLFLDDTARNHWNSPSEAALQVWSQAFLKQRDSH